MKLPLRMIDHHTAILVVDAKQHVIMRLPSTPENRKAGRAVARKLNRSWTYVLFGNQPYEYTRGDWLEERNIKKC